MNNLYWVTLRDMGKASPHGGVFSSQASHPERFIHIVTGTMQDAMAIARTRCLANEVVVSISLQDEDIVVDRNPGADQC